MEEMERTTLLDPSYLDLNALDKEFDILRLKPMGSYDRLRKSKVYLGYYSPIFDEIKNTDASVLSVAYVRTEYDDVADTEKNVNEMFALLKKGSYEKTESTLMKSWTDGNGSALLKPSIMHPSDLAGNNIYILYRLLIFALKSYQYDSSECFNISGKYYYLSLENGAKTIERFTEAQKKKYKGFKKIHPMEISVRKDCSLDFKMKTFTNYDYIVSKINNIKSEKVRKKELEKIGRKPLFILNQEYELERISPSAKTGEARYVERQENGMKYSGTDFLNIVSSQKKFDKQVGEFLFSKTGMLAQLTFLFKNRYEGMAEMVFREFPVLAEYALNQKIQKKFDQLLKKALSGKNVNIINACGETAFSKCTATIPKEDYEAVKSQADIEEEKTKTYVVKMTFMDWLTLNIKKTLDLFCGESKGEILFNAPVESGQINLRLVRSAQYYKDENLKDPYQVDSGKSIQHMTYESFFKSSYDLKETVKDPLPEISVLFSEWIIKNDLLRKRFSLFPWEDLSFSEPVTFALKFEKEDNESFWYMAVQPDGDFEYGEIDWTSPYLVSFMQSGYEKISRLAGSGEIGNAPQLAFAETNFQVLLDYMEILRNYFPDDGSAPNTFLRNKKKRSIFEPLLGVKMFMIDGILSYSAGEVENIKTSYARTSKVKQIWLVDKNSYPKDFIQKLLETLVMPFVRSKRITVFPFPYKYLKEVADMQYKLEEIKNTLSLRGEKARQEYR